MVGCRGSFIGCGVGLAGEFMGCCVLGVPNCRAGRLLFLGCTYDLNLGGILWPATHLRRFAGVGPGVRFLLYWALHDWVLRWRGPSRTVQL